MNKKFSTVSKLVTLLIVVGISFNFIAFLTYDNMTKMKKSIDLIYFGSYVQVVKLKEVNEYIGREIPEAIVKYNNNFSSKSATIAILENSKVKILENWDYYKHTYKTEDEMTLLENTEEIIFASLSWIDELSKYVKKGEKLSLKNMYENVEIIKNHIEKVVKHETDGAYLQKKEINDNYEHTIETMTLILVISFVFVITIAFFIIKNINNKENKLFRLAKELNLANKELKDMTITDPLTTLFNRRYFNTIFDKEFKKAQRDKKPITFMMIDIDFFKKYNDTYGHLEGDENLKKVAQSLKDNLRRPNDYAFRLGGEEFGVLIYDYSVEKATTMAEILVSGVSSLNIEHKSSGVAPHVTISLGFISLVPSPGVDQEKFIQAADEALYQAKETGRNKYYARYSL